VVNNILKVYTQTSDEDRYDWYMVANSWCRDVASQYDLPVEKVCGVVAALSPVKTWEQNLVVAEQLLSTGEAGHIKQFVDKAKRILSEAQTTDDILKILNGNKIKNFYLSILNPHYEHTVVIDRHALSVALGYWVSDEDYRGITNIQYTFFLNCYRLAALKKNIKPNIMQSSTWVVWRRIKKEIGRNESVNSNNTRGSRKATV